MNWPGMMMTVMILLLIQSCANLKQSPEISQNILSKNENQNLVQIVELKNGEAPKLPIDNDHAFLQLRRDQNGQIVPSYQWEICKRRFIVCVKREKKLIFFYDLTWFYQNGWGLTKRRTPK